MGDGIILPAEYDYIYPFRDGTAIVQKNTDTYGSTFGLVDYNGSFILPVEYCDLSRGSYDESDNILRARKRDENFYRYLRPDGKTLTYKYHFSLPLEHNGEVLHETGDYIYTADLSTGDVTANVDVLLRHPGFPEKRGGLCGGRLLPLLPDHSRHHPAAL